MIKYDIYQPAKHLDQVVELEKILWIGKTTEEIYNIFSWKYPVSDLVNGFVALEGDCVVGFRGFFIQNYINESNSFPVAVLGDAAVHSNYQGRGIFSNLTQMALAYYDQTPIEYILALSSNSKSSPGNLKLGWTPFLRKEYRIGFSIQNMLWRRRASKTRIRQCGYEIEIVGVDDMDTLSSDLDIFCQAVDGKGKVSLRRDAHYWKWRFANPDWHVSFAIMRKGGIIKGVIAFLPEKRKRINTIRILDIIVADVSLSSIIIKGLKRITNAWCYFILTTSGLTNTVLKRNFPVIRRSNSNTPADFYLIKYLRNHSVAELGEHIVINYSNID